jgi:hypothetical protein
MKSRHRRFKTVLVACGIACMSTTAALAHHSMAIYEFLATTMEGTVQEFKYVNPHSVIVLKVSGPEGNSAVWYLEGDAPAMLDRDGYSRNTFSPGDTLKLLVHKLKSGQNGGLWSMPAVLEQNGHEFIGHQCVTSPDHCNPQ